LVASGLGDLIDLEDQPEEVLRQLELGWQIGWIETQGLALKQGPLLKAVLLGELGADQVSIFYRRSREEMPVTEVEYDEALAEGVQVSSSSAPPAW
jgi:hypothetical protein